MTPWSPLTALRRRCRPGRRALVAVGILLVCLSAAAPALAVEQVIGRPVLELSAPNNQIAPGETTTLEVQITNDGAIQRAGPAEHVERVTTARGTRIEVMSGDTPIRIETGPYSVGTVPTGTTGPIPIEITVPEDTPTGTYELPVRVRYSYTRVVEFEGDTVEYSDSFSNQVQTITVRVTEDARFEVVSANTTARVGDRGTLSLAVRNAGAESVRDATVRLESQSAALTFGGDPDVSTVVGRWEGGEVRRIEVPVDVEPGAPIRPYAIEATVEYVRPNGTRLSKTLTATVTPRGAPSFALSSVESDLRIGTRGTVRARVTNTGETTAREASVVLAVPWTNRTQEYPVGDLEPGESAEVSFAATVPERYETGRQRVTFRVDHVASTGTRLSSDPLGASVEVGPRRPPIAAESVDSTFEVDSDGRLEVRLTNRAGEPITDVRATLTATDPLSSDDPVAFVPRLDPGESTTVAFQLSVSDDAVAGSHPVTITFDYYDEAGAARQLSDVPVGVTVVEPTGPGVPVEAIVVAVLAVAAGAIWWYRRR